MKRKIFLTLILVWLLYPAITIAHGGPPFISVNNNANLANPAASGSVFFKVPNEIAAQTLDVNQTANFKIDTNLLPVSPDQVSSNDFLWEFGNNKVATGLSVSTTYSKTGSYIVILKVKDPNYQEPIELESMQINILPNKNYQVPKAVIKVNGKNIKDPFQEPVLIEKNSEVEFVASTSQGKVKNYKWDFGDGSKLTTGEKVKHKFDFSSEYAYSYFPVLRVEDENGIYSDAVVQIASDENSENSSTATDSAKNKSSLLLPTVLISAAIFLILGAIFLIFRKNFSRK